MRPSRARATGPRRRGAVLVLVFGVARAQSGSKDALARQAGFREIGRRMVGDFTTTLPDGPGTSTELLPSSTEDVQRTTGTIDGDISDSTPADPTSGVWTRLSAAVPAGATVLPVESNDGFAAGDDIAIEGGGNREERSVTALGSLLLNRPLDNGYPAGSLVSKVLRYSDGYSDDESITKLIVIISCVAVVLAIALALVRMFRHRLYRPPPDKEERLFVQEQVHHEPSESIPEEPGLGSPPERPPAPPDPSPRRSEVESVYGPSGDGGGLFCGACEDTKEKRVVSL